MLEVSMEEHFLMAGMLMMFLLLFLVVFSFCCGCCSEVSNGRKGGGLRKLFWLLGISRLCAVDKHSGRGEVLKY